MSIEDSIRKAKRERRRPAAAHAKAQTISRAELKAHAKKTGSGDFFHPDVMRAFNSRLESQGCVLRNGSILFITSEAFDREGVERQYQVRKMIPGKSISKVAGGYSSPGVMELPELADAKEVLKRTVRYDELEGMQAAARKKAERIKAKGTTKGETRKTARKAYEGLEKPKAPTGGGLAAERKYVAELEAYYLGRKT